MTTQKEKEGVRKKEERGRVEVRGRKVGKREWGKGNQSEVGEEKKSKKVIVKRVEEKMKEKEMVRKKGRKKRVLVKLERG